MVANEQSPDEIRAKAIEARHRAHAHEILHLRKPYGAGSRRNLEIHLALQALSHCH